MKKEKKFIKEGLGNLQRGAETVGGNIFLFPDFLEFRPHKINIQNEKLSIKLSEIIFVKKCWTKLFGFIPLFPNAIVVTTKKSNFTFTLFGREQWISSIEKCKERKKVSNS